MKWWQISKHIEKLNDEVGELCERVARLEADMGWVKWLVVVILGGVLALVAKAYLPF